MKTCSKCGLSKNKENRCMSCHKLRQRQYYQENKEARKKKAKEWIKANPMKVKSNHQAYINTPKGRLVKLMKAAQSRSKKYHHTFDLNSEFLLELWNKQEAKCALTKLQFEFENTTKYEANPFAPSIDRIDSAGGYTKDNVRLVCVAVNYALNEFGEGVFKQICEAYLRECPKTSIPSI